MISVIYIPVIFMCLNSTCNFAYGEYTTTEDSCLKALDAKLQAVQVMAANAGQTITQLKGACITAKRGML